MMDDIHISNKYSYIADNINELKITQRREIMQIIMYSTTEHIKVIEKGNGSQILFTDIPDTIIDKIYKYIYNKLESSSDQ